MIRARIPLHARDGHPARFPSVVLVPRVVRSPSLGLDWILETQLRAWVERALEMGVHFDDPRVLLDPVGATPVVGARAVLVFDRLRRAAYERVLPWLHDRGIGFGVCVATSSVGRAVGRRRNDRVPAWRDLQDLVAIGAVVGTRGHHDVDHRRLAPEQVFHDLSVARSELRKRLGEEPWLLAHTSSRPTVGHAALAAEIGYRVGLVPGRVGQEMEDPLRWPALRPRPWQKQGRVLEHVGVRRAVSGRRPD